jgi:hypothetical protein
MGDMADYYYDQLGDECDECLEINFQCKCRAIEEKIIDEANF